ncbi:MAG TPA: hypothetical protein VG456_19340 [Candidatus Sulfopaludibacter sp.]|nr:hypothetical protein [Candidatus Sulfopaludibacter sp.]
MWRKLKEVKVPEQAKAANVAGIVWSKALDFVAPKRLYRLQVQAGGKWKAQGQSAECTADGYPRDIARSADPLVAAAPLGCLIAKIGGSTADNTGTIFAVGRYCVFQIEEAKAGPLYLGANDVSLYMDQVEAQLTVEIEVAL